MESTTATPPPDGPPAAVADVDQAKVRRAAFGGLAGTALEQYDFVIYGTASAIIFNKLFFPDVSPVVGVLASFATYAVGFGARPLGGLFFSRFGDRYGRKWVLVTTLFLMGFSTLAIGLLPTYQQVGVLAPALLVLCRLLQGFGAGAEQVGGIVLLTEMARPGRRGRLSSMVFVGAAIGTALGAVAWMAAQALPDDALLSWGWRLVFLSSTVVTIAAFVLRRKLDESPVINELKAASSQTDTPVAHVVKHSKPGLARVFFMMVGVSCQSYTYQVFMGSYLITVLKVDAHLIPKVLLLGAVCGMAAAFLAGMLSDVFGRRPLYLAITGLLVVLPVPSFLLLDTGSTWAVYAVITVGFFFAAYGAVGVQAAYFPELFGSRHRYAGVALGREFASVAGGGVAPLICSALLAAFAESWWPVAIYMMAMMAMSFLGAWFSPETRDRALTVFEDARLART
ncbi:MFS transporter [Actinomadura vinacea]|uniref:MFS transporter n=1 Tax=Actinomadura vinacea TaxID=115336 RepID=A0ABN3J486_9ACTN